MTVDTARRNTGVKPGAGQPSGRAHRRARAFTLLSRFGLLLVFAAVVATFAVLNASSFLTIANAQLIALTQAIIGFIALAVMLPMIVGQFDLSAGFQYGLSQGLCAVLILRLGWHPAPAILVVLGTGALVGLVNGLLITRLRLPSFTTTLGVGIIVLGTTQFVTGDEVISGPIPDWFVSLGRSQVAGLPLPFVYLLVVGLVLLFALEYTIWGRRCYAVGSNPSAAHLAGIATGTTIVQAMVIGGLLSAVAGCISLMNLGSSSPTIGLSELLPAFAGAFLGATAFHPGRYNVAGTIVAVYLVGVGIIGLQQLGAASYVEQLFNGGALLIAIIVSSLTGRRT